MDPQNPIVKYSVNPSSFGLQKGSVISDGSNYTIWESKPINTPPIEGTPTFHQYYSVRNTPRTEGTVTAENHFNAWSSLGLDLGTLNFQIVAVEAWEGTGSGSYSVMK